MAFFLPPNAPGGCEANSSCPRRLRFVLLRTGSLHVDPPQIGWLAVVGVVCVAGGPWTVMRHEIRRRVRAVQAKPPTISVRT